MMESGKHSNNLMILIKSVFPIANPILGSTKMFAKFWNVQEPCVRLNRTSPAARLNYGPLKANRIPSIGI